MSGSRDAEVGTGKAEDGGRAGRAVVNVVREDLKSPGERGEDAEHLRIEGID